MPATYYPAILDRSSDGYGASFPDFLGVIAHGSNVTEACVQAEMALALHIEGMAADKDPIPQPSSLEEAMSDLAPGEIGVLVRADVAPKTERVLVSIDSNLLRAIDANASNRSAFLADAARARLSGLIAYGITGQGQLATMNLSDLEEIYGLKPLVGDSSPAGEAVRAHR